MFAPRFGINEEAATGMAAGGLAALLYQRGEVSGDSLVIEQGRLMRPPSPSEILVRLEHEDNSIRRVFVGGRVLIEATRELEFDAQRSEWQEVPTKSAA
jgi:predicted PhzF superfamily epimerase YddE/YHI9